jgi:thioredoxin-related protein
MDFREHVAMPRNLASWTVLGAVLVSTVWGTSLMARPKFMRRTSATQAKAGTETPAANPIQWQQDLRSAQRASRATGRPILIVFGGPRCMYCKKLEVETLGHPSLADYINSEFVPVHLDFDRDRRAAQILEIKSLPTTVVLSSEADLLGTVEGFVRPPEFTKTLHQAVDYQRQLQAERAAGESK